ncbi:hypothetical protein, partial [Rhodanobacter thiooxydans]|uniref:hypothetical protein n=1 Tax=Rhodanobacter thiooxydans TaxID=416169 RepID=UPI000A677725
RLKELHALFPQLEGWKNQAQSHETKLAELAVNFAVMEKDRVARIEETQQQVGRLENIVAFITKESQELREALKGRILDVQQLRDSLSERENACRRDIDQREAEMQALTRRWWWKLGKLIKAL